MIFAGGFGNYYHDGYGYSTRFVGGKDIREGGRGSALVRVSSWNGNKFQDEVSF